jgi:hypothetical protein
MVEEDSDSRHMLEMLNHLKIVEAATATATRQAEGDEGAVGAVVMAVAVVQRSEM